MYVRVLGRAEVTSLGLEVTRSCELPDMALGTSAVLGRSPARAASAATLSLCSPATGILLFQPPCPETVSAAQAGLEAHGV